MFSVEKHLNTIEPDLRDTLINLQNSDTWKIQLISFKFSSVS